MLRLEARSGRLSFVIVRCACVEACVITGWASAAIAPAAEQPDVAERRERLGGDDSSSGDSGRSPARASMPWCGTWEGYLARRDAGTRLTPGGTCPFDGVCDDWTLRDDFIPAVDDPPETIRLSIHVFCEDDGENCAVTTADVAGQMTSLNEHLLPWGFQFVYESEFVNSTEFRYFHWPDEEAPMKVAYADAPAQKLNIYVLDNDAYFSIAVFPWDPGALTFMGGIIMTIPSFAPGGRVMAHEVGHALGLWHTHHGVSEEPLEFAGNPCLWPCYERADGTDADSTGDWCSETAATPSNSTCAPPGGTDACSGVPWGPTDYLNFMGWSPVACETSEFTPQQAGRMHCWVHDVLTGWLDATPEVPTVSEVSALVMGLFVVAAGAVVITRQRGRPAGRQSR